MNPRKTLRIARWEVGKSAGSVDRRTAAALLVALLALGALGAAAADRGVTPTTGIYRVGVAQDSPYHEPVRTDRSLRAVPPDADALGDGVDVLVGDGVVVPADTAKGRAALGALRAAVTAHNRRAMAAEPDQAAAFPVVVQLRYLDQDGGFVVGDGATDSGGDDESGGGTDGERSGTGGGAGGLDGGGGGGGGALPGTGGLLDAGGQSGSPADIAPPFPLQSLLLAFAFLLPLNVVTQAYGSSVVAERINRRGELLLVAPVSRFDVVAGKTLPYLVGALGLVAAVAAAVGGGPVAVGAVAPVVVLFLGATFVGGLFARSYKELTFVTVTISVVVMTYVFVPAIFTDVHPIAAISPLSLVVKDLEGTAVGAGEFAFATLPMTLAAGVLFALGTGIYREEDLFARRAPPAKALDAFAAQLRSRRHVALWSALSIPFVIVAELLAIAVLFVLPTAVSLPVLLAAVAVVEEVAKSVHVYAGFERGRFDRGWRTALVVGGLSGLGFFLGEKLGLIVQLVGLPDLALGRAAFAAPAATALPTAAALLLAPLALHVVTATLSAAGASRSRQTYLLGLGAAVGIHVAYNLAVVVSLV